MLEGLEKKFQFDDFISWPLFRDIAISQTNKQTSELLNEKRTKI